MKKPEELLGEEDLGGNGSDGGHREAEAGGEAQQNEMAEAQKKIAELESEAASHRDRHLRAVADAENLRKRLTREKSEAVKFGNEAVLRDILPVLDNLELAIEHADVARDGKSVVEGVELTLRMFRDVLERHGLKAVEAAAGTPFDPNVHEANGMEVSDSVPPNTIVKQHQRGYFLHERLLRPARVIVARSLDGAL